MLKVDAHSHVGKGAAVWSGQDVVNRMDTMKVDKTIIFPFTEGYFNNDEIMDYVNENPDRLMARRISITVRWNSTGWPGDSRRYR